MKDEISPSQVLLEISRGYSVFTVNNKNYYFKHFSIEEMLELEEFEQNQMIVAKKSGLKTRTELVKDAMKYGAWTQSEEDKITSLEWTINTSLKTLDKMSDPLTRGSFSSQIEKQREELNQLQNKKDKISAYSAESLAQQKRLSKMIKNSLFNDKEFKDPIELKDVEILGALIFSKFAELANKDNLLRASYLSYFFEVFMATKNSLDLFQVKFMDLTLFQKGLISYSRALQNKMENTKMPDEIYGDPIKMFDYVEPKETDGNKSEGIDDIKRKMKARGGELKAEDLLS
jgi:uncharacterized coiled-coil protein SlyX